MKKSELRSLIREEIMKVVETSGTSGFGYKTFASKKPKISKPKKPKKATVITKQTYKPKAAGPQAYGQNTRKREFGK